MSSPLNKLADALPSFILQMQDMKMRQEAQEALSSYRQQTLAATIERNRLEVEAKEAIEIERERRGYYDPPEVKTLRDNISYNLRTLNDPNVALTLGDDEIIKRWKNLKNQQADYFGRTGRDISVSMPVTVGEALAREKEAKKPEVLAAPPKKAKATIPSIQKGRSLLEAELGAPPVSPAEIPEIPEGARVVETDKGLIYTLDEKVWISAETGEPIQ